MTQTTDRHSPSETLLRRALAANAAFSTLSACACLFAPQVLAGFLGVEQGLVFSTGVELSVFAAALFFLLQRKLSNPVPRRATAVVIALDALWVVASAAILLSPNSLTLAGQWAVGLVALAVADLAFFQWKGLRGMSRETSAAPAFSAENASAAL